MRYPALLLLLSIPLLVSTNEPTSNNTLVTLRTGAPGVISAIVETGFISQHGPGPEWPAPAPDTDPANWRVNGRQPTAIHRYTVPYDALPADGSNHPVKVRHRIYLELPKALRDGRRYRVKSPYGTQTLYYSDTTTRCEALKVDQGGYHPGLANRFATLGVYLGDGGSRRYAEPPRFEIRQVDSGALVSEGRASYLADDTGQSDPEGSSTFRSGEHVYRLSLANVPAGGPYFVSVPGCGRSAEFRIGIDAVRDMARFALRGMYHQRCGVALTDAHTAHTRGQCAASHSNVADTRQPFAPGPGDAIGWITVTGTEPIRRVIGGWHDAGDFDRRSSHLMATLWWLSYFEALSHLPPWNDDGWLNIPESGNGVPDFLDEATWAMQSWRALQIIGDDPDRGAILAGTEASGHPGYGRDSAASDTLRYGTYDSDARLTAWSAGAFAQMSRLWRAHDALRSEQWLDAAREAWAWLQPKMPGNFSVASAYAAMQLYLSTGESAFHDAFLTHWATVESGAAGWPEQCLPQNASAQCQFAQFAMYFHPRHRELADASVVARGLQRLENTATGTGYQCDHPSNNPAEPYVQCLRAWGEWGRQVTTALRSDSWIWAWLLLDQHPERGRWFEAVAQLSQFATGLNPMGQPFYTGLGPEAPRSSTHLDSYFTRNGVSDGITTDHVGTPQGQVPGLLIFGPGDRRSSSHWERAVTDKLYPAWDQLPRQRRWGDGWPAIGQNEVLTTNMAYQALVYTFLASVPSSCTGPRSGASGNCPP